MIKLTHGKIRGFLAKYATGAHTLDIGATSGEHKDYFPDSIAVDIDPARKPDVLGDAHRLPFPDGSFERVVCAEMLEHADDPRQVVEEIHRVLAPGGLALLTTRFAFPVHDAPGDYWRFTPYGLRKLFHRFEIVEAAGDSGPFYALGVQLQRIFFQSDVRGGKVTKGLLYLLALLFSRMDWLVVRSYGDINRSAPEDHLLSGGVFIAARKRVS
ncbi:MAG: methyltransferase domain-containing protein [bacterium]